MNGRTETAQKYIMKLLVLLVLTGWALTTWAHHNPVAYNGKITVTITGVVAKARYGFPHSRYSIDVVGENGEVERWLLTAEDPRDAIKLGFADALKGIKAGDTLTVVGWPSKTNPRELRGHQLRYPDGHVVKMRSGNYLWTKALRRIWRLRDGQEPFQPGIGPIGEDVTGAGRVTAWIKENDAVSRIAYEIRAGTAKLIAINRGKGFEYPGVRKFYLCHTDREGFSLMVDHSALLEGQRSVISNGAGYIARYNDLLSRYWEYNIEGC